MKLTIDINSEHELALTVTIDPAGNEHSTQYVALVDAPPLEAYENLRESHRRQVYLRQHHYVASHVMVGLITHDRVNADNTKPPKHGWTRWKNL